MMKQRLARALTLIGVLLIPIIAFASEQRIPSTTPRLHGKFKMQELASVATPASGWGYLYFKDDGKIYAKNDAGTEYNLTSGGTYVGRNSTNLSPATAGDDWLNDNGTTVGWRDGNGSGTLDLILGRVSSGIMSIGGGAAAAGGFELLEDTDNGANYGLFSVGQSLGGNRTYTFQDASYTVVGRDTTDALSNKTISCTAGSTSVAPLVFASGTNLTTAAAGAHEYDGRCFYNTSVASSRQLVMTPQVLCINSPYTLTDTTNQQALFGSSGAALTVAAGTTYQFEGYFAISSMSATSGNCKFSPAGIGAAGGTATILSCTWECTGLDATTPGTAAAVSGSTAATTTADPISTGDMVVAGTGTAMYAHVSGTIRINAGGTLIPAISLTTGSVTPAVAINSYFRIWPVGSGTVTTIGNWN